MTLSSLVVSFALLAAPGTETATAGTFVWSEPTGPLELRGMWRAKAGDDLAYAAPGFDDASWELVPMPDEPPWRLWDPPDGFVWFRAAVVLPEADVPLVFMLPGDASLAIEVFCDGASIGTVGGLEPLALPRLQTAAIDVPASCRADRRLELALRTRGPPVRWVRTGRTAFVVPKPSELFVRSHLDKLADRTLWVFITIVAWLLALYLLGSWWRLRPAAPAFSWLAASFFFAGLWSAIWSSDASFRFLGTPGTLVLVGAVNAEAMWRVARPTGSPRWLRWPLIGTAAFGLCLMLPGDIGWRLVDWPWRHLVGQLPPSLAVLVVIPVLWRRGGLLRVTAAALAVLSVSIVVSRGIYLVGDGFGLLRVLTVVGFGTALIALGGAVLHHHREAIDEREAEQRASRRFVPADFLALLGHENVRDVARADARQLELTVMFCDIRGFTARAERLGPDGTFAFMNDYHARMEPLIAGQGGFINQIYGDGIMAMFPTPTAAAAAATAMLAARGDDVEIGIGLHTGPVMLGTIGSEERLDTGVLGDTVNTAARLQELTKEHGHAIIASGATVAALDVSGTALGDVELRGKSEPLKIYGLG